MTARLLTPWLDKRACAEHFGCSVLSIELAMAEGCPYAVIFGRPKFQAPEVEAWLEQAGHLERRGDATTLRVDESAPQRISATGPDTRRIGPHVDQEA
jgi:hypothetical protein